MSPCGVDAEREVLEHVEPSRLAHRHAGGAPSRLHERPALSTLSLKGTSIAARTRNAADAVPQPCRASPAASTVGYRGVPTLALPSAGLRLPSETTASCCAHTHTKPTAQHTPQPRCARHTARSAAPGITKAKSPAIYRRNGPRATLTQRCAITAQAFARIRVGANGGTDAAALREVGNGPAAPHSPSRDVRRIPRRAPGWMRCHTARSDAVRAACVATATQTGAVPRRQTQRTPITRGYRPLRSSRWLAIPARGRG